MLGLPWFDLWYNIKKFGSLLACNERKLEGVCHKHTNLQIPIESCTIWYLYRLIEAAWPYIWDTRILWILNQIWDFLESGSRFRILIFFSSWQTNESSHKTKLSYFKKLHAPSRSSLQQCILLLSTLSVLQMNNIKIMLQINIFIWLHTQ